MEYNSDLSAGVQHVHVNHDKSCDYEKKNQQRYNVSPTTIKFCCDGKDKSKPHQITAHGLGLNGFNIGEIASFVVDTSYASLFFLL